MMVGDFLRVRSDEYSDYYSLFKTSYKAHDVAIPDETDFKANKQFLM